MAEGYVIFSLFLSCASFCLGFYYSKLATIICPGDRCVFGVLWNMGRYEYLFSRLVRGRVSRVLF